MFRQQEPCAVPGLTCGDDVNTDEEGDDQPLCLEITTSDTQMKTMVKVAKTN